MSGPGDIRGTPHKGDKQGSLIEKCESNAWGILGDLTEAFLVRGGDPEGLKGDLWVSKGPRMGLWIKV